MNSSIISPWGFVLFSAGKPPPFPKARGHCAVRNYPTPHVLETVRLRNTFFRLKLASACPFFRYVWFDPRAVQVELPLINICPSFFELFGTHRLRDPTRKKRPAPHITAPPPRCATGVPPEMGGTKSATRWGRVILDKWRGVHWWLDGWYCVGGMGGCW